MYVIFPADEVVYLSYGRIIYVPFSSQSSPVSPPRPSTSDNPPSPISRPPDPPADPAPVKPERKKNRNLKINIVKREENLDRKQSFSDFLAVNRDKITRNLSVKSDCGGLTVKRDKSPVFNIFKERSCSPRLGRDRTNFDFDSRTVRQACSADLGEKKSLNCSREDNKASSLVVNQQLTPTERSSPTKKKTFFTGIRSRRTPEPSTMAAGESAIKDLTHPGYNEQLKAHNAVTFKLVRTVSDFTQQLSQMYEQHAQELQMLVASFRKKNGELRKERPACPSSLFHTWETLLQEVEIDSQALGDIASILGRQVSRPLLERSFHRKIQSRKVFTHRESYETIITKTEEKLAKCRLEYKAAYLAYLSTPSTETLSAYFNTHNAYVQQLHATNGMLEEYGKETLPSLLQELEEIYSELCSTVTEGILQGAEVVSSRAMEKCRRYEGLIGQCRAVSSTADVSHLARSFPPPQGRPLVTRRPFVPPQPPAPPPDAVDGEVPDIPAENIPPPLRDELVIDRLSATQLKPSAEALRGEALELEAQIRGIQEALDTLLRIQQRSVESALYNKANELQEDISMKRFDLRVARLHLSAINAQKELFTTKLEGASGGVTSGDSVRDRKLSSASTATMKTKWLKAFKSLKTPPPPETSSDKKNGAAATRELLKGDPDAHNFQEYTYKKITPCDICSQILRGHTRQGLRCRICKLNVHVDCQDKASKCQTKARLLRRQKSTSEIETRVLETNQEEDKSPEVDQIYQVLKQATEISNAKPRMAAEAASGPPPVVTVVDSSSRTAGGSGTGSSGGSGQSLNRRPPPRQPQGAAGTLSVVDPAPCSTSSAPHSPRRQKLNLRMKSLSLDSPESTEHATRRRHHGANTTSDPHSNQSSSSRIQSPSSPVHNRRLLSAKNIRMSSVELPDDNEKSPSSASTSPCPSPVGANKKSHRLLPTNLYVVLYNFKSRHQDELDLKAGYKVTVIDTSDPDWWKGKCFGRMGYFPSKYVSKLSPGEKPLQVTHNLQVSDGDNGLMLLRDQIVIQIGEELDGMVMIRSGDNRQGVCPVKFLQEV